MIQARSVSKSFGNIVAVNNVSFNIEKGEIFGILGPNGAGKSTIVNILNTLVKPDTGDIIIDGVNIKGDGDSIKLIMGVVPQEIALYEELSAYENLMFWGGLYDIPKQELRLSVVNTLDIVDLVSRKDDKIKTFSGGMKRRINIACSLLHNPKILVLDEPTVGVDPQNRNHIFEVIERLNNEGMTIIYTTHYMEEAERFCHTIAIIDIGRIIAQGTLKELRKVSDVKDLLTIKLADSDNEIVSRITSANPLFRFDSISNTLKVECGNIGAYDGRSEPVKLLVTDMDQTSSSKEIIHKIDSLEDIRIIISDSIKSKELVIKWKYACALIFYKGFQDSLEAGNTMPVELVYDRSREMEIGILQQSLISTLMSSTGIIIVKKSIEKYLKDQFPAIDNSTRDNIINTAIKKDNNTPTIKSTSIVGMKNDTKLGLIQALAGTAILMLLFSVAGVGTSILEEKEKRFKNRNQSAQG